MLLDMVSYCHHQRLIPLMDAFPMECFLFSIHTHKSLVCSQQREKFPVLILTHLAHLFYYHFPLSLRISVAYNAGQIYYSAIMRFTVYSVVKSPLFPSARQSVCQKRRAAAHYKELLYSKWRRLFCAPGALLFFSLYLCGIVFFYPARTPYSWLTVPLRARFIYIRRIMFYITLESLIFCPCVPGLFYLFYSLWSRDF